MCVRVLGHDSPHGVSQLKQVLRILPARAGRVQDLVGYLLQGSGAEVVWIAPTADVEQGRAWRVVELLTGVEGHRDDLITTFFTVVEVVFHFLLPACWQLIGDAPNAPLKTKSQRRNVY